MDITLRPPTSNDASALEKLFRQLGYEINRTEIQKKRSADRQKQIENKLTKLN